MDTRLRQWTMLRAIPRQPNRRSTGEIVNLVSTAGFRFSKRTIERDLDNLSSIFPYTCDEEGRAKFWYWPRDAAAWDLPAMTPEVALAWVMACDHLRRTMPPSATANLEPYFARAEEFLDTVPRKRGGRWQHLFRIARRTPHQVTPNPGPGVFGAVAEALLREQQLRVVYAARSRTRARELTLHPSAMVFRDGVYYLIAFAGDHATPAQFALHRIREATPLAKSTRRASRKMIDAFVDTTFRHSAQNRDCDLRLRVAASVAEHLRERPLAPDQKICAEENTDWHTVTATVLDSVELRWWILGFGDLVVVEEPSQLYEQVRGTIARMAARYA